MIRALVAAGGLAGAAGVTLSAVASHLSGGGTLASAGQFLLFHAPVFLVLAALGRAEALPERFIALVAGLFALGLTLFAGDLSGRVVLGRSLFASAAPFGGTVLILSWLVLGLGGVLLARR